MKRIPLSLLSMLLLSIIGSCSQQTPKTVEVGLTDVSKSAQEQLAQAHDMARYKLFPTQNIWTFIKLDTQTGQMWQVQYSVQEDNARFEYDLNPNVLISSGKKTNGRFELYPTQNIYNFILLDQIEGKTWQVQWSIDEDKRGVFPIYQ